MGPYRLLLISFILYLSPPPSSFSLRMTQPEAKGKNRHTRGRRPLFLSSLPPPAVPTHCVCVCVCTHYYAPKRAPKERKRSHIARSEEGKGKEGRTMEMRWSGDKALLSLTLAVNERNFWCRTRGEKWIEKIPNCLRFPDRSCRLLLLPRSRCDPKGVKMPALFLSASFPKGYTRRE